jgi:hypothetical protein
MAAPKLEICIAQFPFRIKNLTIDFRIRQPRNPSPCFAKCDAFRRIIVWDGHLVTCFRCRNAQKEMGRALIVVAPGRRSGLSGGTGDDVLPLFSRCLSLVDFRLSEGGATACDK